MTEVEVAASDETTRRAGRARARGARLVLLHSDEVSAGRRARRERVLAMRPIDPTVGRLAERSRAPHEPGVYWEYVRTDGIPLFARARDVSDEEEARWDAVRVFTGASALRILYVRDRESGQLSWWLADASEAVLVAPRLWPGAQQAAVVRHAKRAFAALRVRPPWGEYLG